MICRLLATRCCISWSRISFCWSRSSFSCSASRRRFHVLYRQKYGGGRTIFVEHPAGIEEHHASADRREFVLDLIGLDGAALRNDVFEERPEPGNVPLPVGRSKAHWPSVSLRHCECAVERRALPAITRKSGSSTRSGSRMASTMASAKLWPCVMAAKGLRLATPRIPLYLLCLRVGFYQTLRRNRTSPAAPWRGRRKALLLIAKRPQERPEAECMKKPGDEASPPSFS